MREGADERSVPGYLERFVPSHEADPEGLGGIETSGPVPRRQKKAHVEVLMSGHVGARGDGVDVDIDGVLPASEEVDVERRLFAGFAQSGELEAAVVAFLEVSARLKPAPELLVMNHADSVAGGAHHEGARREMGRQLFA